ncbi:efflux RND transporter periplasmic adaptor subunit [Pleionea litopenaei]|uniref:Efflux RND transporter periplasmic adaptor subunit n=1 Tax=Pleionea litopenaei TaxID=3070815 RepID=A0AA51RSK7_9GAMM|nr:efflux RND transporter periplasmic adaptor subunit [Pleionea sp. HL-JVS1]WMS86729.1 efflux RND transporter periplasmic adaptor subunit [Pleionea sp. HL-JVS1]
MSNAKPNKGTVFLVVASMLIGALVTMTLNTWVLSKGTQSEQSKEPLYWVAPMDPNYRRDQPGKSPMGMDLVPVYEEPQGQKSAGMVAIDPQVVNNLGVRRGTAQLRQLTQDLRSVGYIQYDQKRLVHIHPRVAGWVEQLMVNAEGDPVTKGQPLYSLYSPELVNAQEELLIALQRNNQRLVQAAMERLKALQLDDKTIASIKRNQEVMQKVIFYAPQDGVVDNLRIREGFFVQPGNTLMSIGDLSRVWVEAELFERQASQVNVGEPVTMTLDSIPGRQWQGRVDYIYPTLDATTRTLRLRLEFSNDDQALKPNMFAQIQIHSTQSQPVLTVPREAVIRTGVQDRIVVELEPGVFKSVAVKLGSSNREFFEILEGVELDDTVITSAQFLIDSESSKSSDFMRQAPYSQKPSSVWTEITLIEVDDQSRTVKASHPSIDEWDWPAMTMNFEVDNAVDFSLLSAGKIIHAQLSERAVQGEQSYLITDIHIMDGESSTESHSNDYPSATVTGEIQSIEKSSRAMLIHRSAIEKWNRPATTMTFKLDESINIDDYRAGDSVRFTFEVRDDFVIVAMEGIVAGDKLSSTDQSQDGSSMVGETDHDH